MPLGIPVLGDTEGTLDGLALGLVLGYEDGIELKVGVIEPLNGALDGDSDGA